MPEAGPAWLTFTVTPGRSTGVMRQVPLARTVPVAVLATFASADASAGSIGPACASSTFAVLIDDAASRSLSPSGTPLRSKRDSPPVRSKDDSPTSVRLFRWSHPRTVTDCGASPCTFAENSRKVLPTSSSATGFLASSPSVEPLCEVQAWNVVPSTSQSSPFRRHSSSMKARSVSVWSV